MYFKLIKFFMALIVVLSTQITFAEMVVIIHPNNHTEINRASIQKIFLGKTKSFLNGDKAIPIELKSGEIRDAFLMKILKRGENNLYSYWSRMLFSGKARPPKSFIEQSDIKEMVAQNPNVIGYIDREFVDDSVMVVFLYQTY